MNDTDKIQVTLTAGDMLTLNSILTFITGMTASDPIDTDYADWRDGLSEIVNKAAHPEAPAEPVTVEIGARYRADSDSPTFALVDDVFTIRKVRIRHGSDSDGVYGKPMEYPEDAFRITYSIKLPAVESERNDEELS